MFQNVAVFSFVTCDAPPLADGRAGGNMDWSNGANLLITPYLANGPLTRILRAVHTDGTWTNTHRSRSMDVTQLRKKLVSIGQDQVLRFYDQLSEPSKTKLLAQLEALDLDRMKEL